MRIAIVEDEPLARRRLKRLLAAIPDAVLAGEAADPEHGLDMIRETEPDVLLLDIEMPGMTGLQMLERLERRPVVIFVTAYEEYAIDAFDVAAADYVVKPLSLDRLAGALERARRWLSVPEAADTLLFHRIGTRVRPLRASEVECFDAQGDYVAACSGGKSVLLHTTLSDLESKLPAGRFARVHRSTIVNLGCIVEARPRDGNRLELRLESGRSVTTSRRRTPAIRALLR